MNRDYEASEVTVGSRWYGWGVHYEIVERFDQRENVKGAPEWIPYIRYRILDASGKPKGKPSLPVEAWRVVRYCEPSVAFA